MAQPSSLARDRMAVVVAGSALPMRRSSRPGVPRPSTYASDPWSSSNASTRASRGTRAADVQSAESLPHRYACAVPPSEGRRTRIASGPALAPAVETPTSWTGGEQAERRRARTRVRRTLKTNPSFRGERGVGGGRQGAQSLLTCPRPSPSSLETRSEAEPPIAVVVERVARDRVVPTQHGDAEQVHADAVAEAAQGIALREIGRASCRE